MRELGTSPSTLRPHSARPPHLCSPRQDRHLVGLSRQHGLAFGVDIEPSSNLGLRASGPRGDAGYCPRGDIRQAHTSSRWLTRIHSCQLRPALTAACDALFNFQS